MNDVSTLFPLPADAAGFGAFLAASDPGVGGVLLPESLVQAVAPILRVPPPPGGDSDLLKYADLRVVGMRIDPCFAAADMAAADAAGTCVNQLRLIFQSVAATEAGGRYAASDAAFHALYVVSRRDLVNLIQAVVALRMANQADITLAALAPHPILASQGMTGPMGQGLMRLIQAYAGQGNLVRFTRFTRNGGVGPKWTFDGFDVAGGGVTPVSITSNLATIPQGTKTQAFFSGFGGSANLAGGFLPALTDGLAVLTNVADSRAATPAVLQAAFDVALKMENPHLATATVTDCASCHVAGPGRALVGEPLFALSAVGNPNLYLPDPALTAAETAQDTPFFPDFLNLHAFSYSGQSPGINFRVINETAAVVTFVNDRLLASPVLDDGMGP